MTRQNEGTLRRQIAALACQHGRFGYRQIAGLLRNESWRVNHKLVERIWLQEGPNWAQLFFVLFLLISRHGFITESSKSHSVHDHCASRTSVTNIASALPLHGDSKCTSPCQPEIIPLSPSAAELVL